MIAAAPFNFQEQQYYYPVYSAEAHPSAYFYMPSSTSDEPVEHGGKRVKLEQQQELPSNSILPYYPEPYSSLSAPATGLQQGYLQAPNISFHRTPEQPASPITVATTLSQYSTPSRSPSRVSIVSDSSQPTDWVLFDESMNTLAQDPSKDRSSNFTLNQHTPNVPTINTSQSHLRSYPLPMDSALHQTFYSSFPAPDFTKLSQHSVINPYSTNYNNSQSFNEDDIPALSPSGPYPPSSHQSVCGDLRSPMTPIGSPRSNDGERAPHARVSAPHIHNPAPKFTRTVSDAVEDELFRSSTSENTKQQHSGQRQSSMQMSPSIAKLYQQAQEGHALEARNVSPTVFVARDKSPFRANSPFHPLRTPSGVQTAPVRRNFLGNMTAQGKREQQQELELQSINDRVLLSEAEQLASTPKTISPKDAVLEYPDPEDEASKMSLFAHEQQCSTYGNGNNGHVHNGNHNSYQGSAFADDRDSYNSGSRRGSEAESLSSIGAYSYNSSPMIASSFPFAMQTLGSSDMGSSTLNTSQNQSQSSSALTKPEGTKADTGAYTCTIDGCQQRFPTPAKLNKHKRENHRQSSAGSAGMTSTLQGGLNRLQGPHRCLRTNPTTGKPCNTIFSRPYDLTRHEDTIHNTNREKVRCDICNDDKTFSRQDALTRHKKVKHGIDK